MCGQGFTSAFCPTMVLNRVFDYNNSHNKKNQIVILPISAISNYLRVDIVTYKDMPQPLFVNKFIEILQQEIKDVYEKIKLHN